MLVLHYTGMPTRPPPCSGCAPPAEVSCHYVVLEDGRIFQLVPEAPAPGMPGPRAGRARRTSTPPRSASRSSIPGHDGGYRHFPPRRSTAVTALGLDIAAPVGHPPERVLAHSDVAPGRKLDPGEKFPWRRLHAAGVGHWTEPAPLGDGRVLRPRRGRPAHPGHAGDARRFMATGLTSPASTTPDRSRGRAFQRHFRPGSGGRHRRCVDLTTLRDLIRSRPAPPSHDSSEPPDEALRARLACASIGSPSAPLVRIPVPRTISPARRPTVNPIPDQTNGGFLAGAGSRSTSSCSS